MKILSIGTFSTYGISNTCLHRNWALKEIADVDEIDSSLVRFEFIYRVLSFLFRKKIISIPFNYASLNKKILRMVENNKYDVIWIDKGIHIKAETLQTIKKYNKDTLIVGYSPDNMVERHNQSVHFLQSFHLYDYYVTTKSYTVEALKKLGCKKIIFVNNAYEPRFHHPYDIGVDERNRLGGEIGFIGMWEQERCNSILYLAKHGLPIRVWGGGKWLNYKGLYPNLKIEETGLFSEDYNKALSAFDISLCFLRKINFDVQTTRTMEIPACKSMLMAERTDEHRMLFNEDSEAVFFSSDKELYDKCKYYIEHPSERNKIIENGYRKCLSSGYSNKETLKRVLEFVINERNNKKQNETANFI